MMATIAERYAQKFGKSVEWYERGKSLFAGGITHQTRFISPFPVYIDYAEGPYKYDVDENQIIDYVMGNGSLLMGHSPAEVMPIRERDFLPVGSRACSSEDCAGIPQATLTCHLLFLISLRTHAGFGLNSAKTGLFAFTVQNKAQF